MTDVCLLLEGTYPYVAGGVSTWVHDLIGAMRDIRFGILYVAPYSDPTRTLKYEIPPNVLFVQEIFLHDYNLETFRRRPPVAADYEVLRRFYEGSASGDLGQFGEFLRLFQGERCCFDMRTFFSSREIWDLLVHFYDRWAGDLSFLDFFWTWRSTHLPLLQVLSAPIPRARIYHAISTGYAGLLGAMAKVLHGEKFFLTEHGIYTHERWLEISQAHWIYEREKRHYRADRELPILKRWWIRMFELMSGLTYQNADRIFTLFEGNKIREILSGAPADSIEIIPNGIRVERYAGIVPKKRPHPQVGFVGRVVNIKDVKTFIAAADLVLRKRPEVMFHIVGPTEEEPEYYDECLKMVESRNLEGKVNFAGKVDMREYYAFLDLVVLTSLSEAQPYAILEANAAGIPVVATDVGACRGMLEGEGLPDKALGPSGLVTPVADPRATAEAILRLLDDKALYRNLAEAGQKRVEQFYNMDDLLSRYLNIYEQSM